jgi:hypothetical protein
VVGLEAAVSQQVILFTFAVARRHGSRDVAERCLSPERSRVCQKEMHCECVSINQQVGCGTRGVAATSQLSVQVWRPNRRRGWTRVEME